MLPNSTSTPCKLSHIGLIVYIGRHMQVYMCIPSGTWGISLLVTQTVFQKYYLQLNQNTS